MLKDQELRLKEVMNSIGKNTELHLKSHSDSFTHVVKDMRAIAKERNILFVEAIKKIKEDVNFKFEELYQEMMKEVAKFDQNYSNLHTKVDIVAVAVTKLVELNTSLLDKVDLKFESDSKEFVHMSGLLEDLKELILKLNVSPSSSVS